MAGVTKIQCENINSCLWLILLLLLKQSFIHFGGKYVILKKKLGMMLSKLFTHSSDLIADERVEYHVVEIFLLRKLSSLLMLE